MTLLVLLRSPAVAEAIDQAATAIQPIHGYSFENDRRLLKARRDKEAHDKLSFAEQLEVIKPKIVTVTKTDHQAARDFVERITALIPVPGQATRGYLEPKITRTDYLISHSSDSGDDEAIALIVAALL